MYEQVAGPLLGIGDAESHALASQHAGVADLAAGLRVERRLVQHDRAALAGLEAVDLGTVFDQRGHRAFRALGLVAQELSRAELFAQREPDRFGRRVARA